MKKRLLINIIFTVFVLFLFDACTRSSEEEKQPENGDTPQLPTELIQPEDFEYKGAFRLPGGSNGTNWEWSGNAMAYYPDGDSGGSEDNYPGSIFATGHDWEQQISEITIPVPIISQSKSIDHLNSAENITSAKVIRDLNTAVTIQEFHDIRGELVKFDLELPRAGLAYLPKQGSQSYGKIYFCWGEHYQETQVVSHGWCEINLSDPKTAGGWFIGDRSNYSTNDYLFEIPEVWASAYTPGKLLATGRFRDGGWSGQGPSLFAIGPWNEGNPPPPGKRLKEIPLILYSSTLDNPTVNHTMNGYHHSDEWSGGAWLTSGNKAAVIFVGTKGTGDCWYGFSNGIVWPDEPPYPEIPDPPHDIRGWWSTGFEGQFIFYDPTELAKVAQGTMEPYEPQPFANLNIDKHLYSLKSSQQKYHLGAASFDRKRSILYVFEYRADGDKCLVHVWKINTES